MRMLLLYILLVAFGCQQTPFLESENLKNSESEKSCEPRAMSNEPFSETEKSVNISEICGNEKTNHKLVQKKSEKGCEQRAMSYEPFFESENLKTSESEKSCEPRAMSHETFFESEKSVNISEICGNEKTNHRFTQKKSEKSSEPRAMSNEPFLESENLKTSESEKGSEPQAMSHEQRFRKAQSSQHEAQSLKKTVDCCPLTVDYFENQIRLADSLYKNYLPQYNFEEVKAAVMFFDSLRLTTDLLESENLKTSESEKSCEQRAMSNETFLESEESVNISEICGNEKTNHRLVQKKSEKSCEPRAMSNEQKSLNAQSSQLEAQSLKKTVDCCPLTVDYFENQIRLADSLYKNYLPQYNFEEVKAAMEFFDSYQQSAISGQRWRLFGKEADDGDRLIAESRQLTAAKAHYYHAVGLTERDDIVGACEHYLCALEIMEEMMANGKRLKSKAHGSQLEAHSLDYEKIRCLALINIRLAELLYENQFCDLSIKKCYDALVYAKLIDDVFFEASILKEIGHSFQLLNNPDSALFYYNRSLMTNQDESNYIDIQKCIAKILFDKGKKDSAYILIKKNLVKIKNINVRYSYYNTLGEMYIEDIKYDSAIHYFEKSISSNIPSIKVNSAIKLSAIHDSIGDYEKKAYYDDIVSKISISDINKNIERNKLQDVYDRYKERKVEKEKIKSRTRTKVIAISLSLLIIISFVITILIWHKSKRKDRIHQESLNEKDRYIANKEEVISRTNEEIERKESEIKKLVEMLEDHRSVIKSLKNDAAIKEEEISCKENDIKKMENDLSVKEMELKRLLETVHDNRILIDRLNEDNIAKEKQIECYLEEIDDNRQVINDKNHLISIATEGLVTRKDAIAENRNEIARLQAIIGKNEKVLNELSEDYRNNKEQIAAYIDEIEKLKTEISETQKNLIDLRFKNSFTEGKIKKQNAELKKKEELIGKYTTEISNLKYRLERNHIDISNLNNYLQSDICSKILNDINEISDKKLKSNILSPLSKKEFVLLLNSANHHLNYFINDMAKKYQKLKKEDQYYLCLVIMGLNNNQISSLFGVTYDTIQKRKNKICVILGLDPKENLYNYILRLI